jgi:CRP/FNR family transcriptional regulator, polysaccharide utilization system transcription regulator
VQTITFALSFLNMDISAHKTKLNALLFSEKSVFKHLSENEIAMLPFDNPPLEFKKGTIIYKEKSRLTGFYYIVSGIIKVYKTGFDGKEQIIRFAQGNDIIGFRSVLSKESACTTAKVIENAVLYYISSDALFTLIKTNGDFSIGLLQLTCRELEESNSYITDIAQKTVRERLAEVLIQLMYNFDTDKEQYLNIRLTREDIANIVGTATESVIRLLSDMKQEGLIDLSGRKIKILDFPKLKRVSGL